MKMKKKKVKERRDNFQRTHPEANDHVKQKTLIRASFENMTLQRTAELCEDRKRFAGMIVTTSIFGATFF
jgi:hypothetical protein